MSRIVIVILTYHHHKPIPVPGGCKYRDLALQVWGATKERVRCSHGFCRTWTRERQQIVRMNYRPILLSGRVPHNMKWGPSTKKDWLTDHRSKNMLNLKRQLPVCESVGSY
jgi:hypothetical protein